MKLRASGQESVDPLHGEESGGEDSKEEAVKGKVDLYKREAWIVVLSDIKLSIFVCLVCDIGALFTQQRVEQQGG